MHLLRRLAGGAGLVGAVDLVGGVIVQQFGGAVLERLSASAAESAYAAQKMARLGISRWRCAGPSSSVPVRRPRSPASFPAFSGKARDAKSNPQAPSGPGLLRTWSTMAAPFISPALSKF